MPPSVAMNNNNNNNNHLPNNGPPGSDRPSAARRQRLNEELSVPTVSNFFPIERYYDAADKVYESVLEAHSKKVLDDAYLFGKRYCTFCLEAIPTHNYYGLPKYRPLKQKHTNQIEKVLTILEQVAVDMDKEELQLQKLAAEKAAKEKAERERIEKIKFEQLQQRVARQKQMARSTGGSANIEESALSKLEKLRPPSSQRIRRDPSGEQGVQENNNNNNGSGGSRYKLVLSSDDEEDENAPPSLPPPLLPPPPEDDALAPPPYTAVASTRRYHPQPSNEEAVEDSGWKIRLPTPEVDDDSDGGVGSNDLDGAGVYQPNRPRLSQQEQQQQQQSSSTTKKKKQSMRKLQNLFRDEYKKFQQSNKIQVSLLDTFQGRCGDSTNGCTVISALVAAHHLKDRSKEGISNSAICNIIDSKCGPILRTIRRKLGLAGAALIIPSDVHDHLVDAKILQQEKFEGAAGGNIVDRSHYGEFLKLLAVGEDGKSGVHCKAAATLFFREHVISIVKIPVGNGAAYYDLVDSLPTVNGRATRTRCVDIQSLEVLLQWYASRKFSDSNCTYIDRNPWDDAMADIDPRVFQGFVWMDKKQ